MRIPISYSDDAAEFCRRILFVENDPSVLNAIAGLLVLGGYDVFCARTVAEARDKLIWQPDFLFTAMALPDGSGLELIRRLRRRNDPIIIAVVRGAGEATGNDLAQLRPDAIFENPIDANAILAWLAEADQRSTGSHDPA